MPPCVLCGTAPGATSIAVPRIRTSVLATLVESGHRVMKVDLVVTPRWVQLTAYRWRLIADS